jgi:uncharacterized membrane protein
MAQIATRPVRRLAWTAGKKALRSAGSHLLETGATALREAADRTASTGRKAIAAGFDGRPPIQVGIDVAVPLEVAWDEWTSFTELTEGVHRIEDVERNGDRLLGRTAGPRSADWEAEIVDERPQESFAWRSVEGSDCAGLATFHRLSDRLTRIELDLDVLPTTPLETLALSLRLADRRAEAELRRFKARVEFINPDVYEQKGRQ